MGKVFWVGIVFVLMLCNMTQAAPLTDNGNGTVSDLRTGLIWQQGQGYKTWLNALSYCINDVSLGGHTDWRLPNVRELESITDDTRDNPAIDTDFFPGAVSSNYWSSTTNPGRPTYAWHVRIAFTPNVEDSDKRNSFYVRCVRGGQACSTGNLAKRISGEVETYHSTIQGAYDAESNDHILQTKEAVFCEQIYFDADISVLLTGGYDDAFALQTGYSVINGAITISAGAVDVENIVIY